MKLAMRISWLFALGGLLLAPAVLAQATMGTIAGTVTDVDDGLPLPGANVFIAGTAQGAAADFDGNYRITGLGKFIFASGKDRRESDGEVHTNFSIARDGEYLALIRPDGIASSEFSPAFPSQSADVSYGRQIEIIERELLAGGSMVKFRVPTDGSDDATWMLPGFNDSSWAEGPMGLGYDDGSPNGGGFSCGTRSDRLGIEGEVP